MSSGSSSTVGSWVVRQVEHAVPDTTSGFRAYTREAALRMSIVSDYSYTLESIIQAGKRRMAIAHVPFNPTRSGPPSLRQHVRTSSGQRRRRRIYAMRTAEDLHMRRRRR
jgi:hypothetical protein